MDEDRTAEELWLFHRMHLRARKYGNHVAIECLAFDAERFCSHVREEATLQKILCDFYATLTSPLGATAASSQKSMKTWNGPRLTYSKASQPASLNAPSRNFAVS